MAITVNELRALEVDELATKLKEAKEELFNLRFQAATGQLETMDVSMRFAKRLLGSTRSCESVNWELVVQHDRID